MKKKIAMLVLIVFCAVIICGFSTVNLLVKILVVGVCFFSFMDVLTSIAEEKKKKDEEKK